MLSFFSRPAPLRHPNVVAGIALFGVVLLLYSASMGHNFLFDEDDIVLLNPVLQNWHTITRLFEVGFFQKAAGLDNLWEQYFRPLTLLTFFFDRQIWHVNPFGFNLTNTLLHAFVAVLFFRFLLRIFQDHFTAFLCALLYAVHTIHTEAVTYIASRGDLLAAACLLGALMLYWRGRYGWVFFLYILSPFFKESGLVLPVYLILLDVAFIRTPLRKLFFRMIPFLLAGAAYVFYRKYFSPVPMGPPDFNAHHALLRFLSMGGPLLRYFEALLLPESFKFCKSIEYAFALNDARVYTTLAVFGLLFAGWLLAARRRGAAFFGLSFFAVAIGPALQIIHYFPEWAEHYLYLPAMGLVIVLGSLMREIFRSSWKPATALCLAVYIPFLGFIAHRTIERNSYYIDSEHYYYTLARSDSPYAYYGYINLGIIAITKHSWDEAAIPIRAAYKLMPDAESNNYNMGLYSFQKKRFEEAAQFFEKAYTTEMGKHQPLNLMWVGLCHMRLGQYDKAIEYFERCQRRAPEATAIYRNLIRVYELAGKPDQALRWAEIGLKNIGDKGSDMDHAALLMETILLAYLNGWQDVWQVKLNELVARHSRTTWFGDAAKFLKGQMTQDQYEDVVQVKYPYNAKDARLYMLMSYVMKEEWREVGIFMQKYQSTMQTQSQDPLILEKMFERAKQVPVKLEKSL